MSPRTPEQDVADALSRLRPEVPRTAGEAATLRGQVRDVDRALGALLRADADEEE